MTLIDKDRTGAGGGAGGGPPRNALRDALDGAGIGILELDFATGAAIASEALARSLGEADFGAPGPFDSLRGKIGPDDRTALDAAVERARTSRLPFALRVLVDRPDGTRRAVALTGRVAEDAASHRLVVVATDLEPIRQAQAAHREAERRFRTLADAMPQMVWSTRPDGYHDYYNGQWYEFTGVAERGTDGEGWNAMFHPDDQALAWERWRHSLATGDPYEIEYRLRHRSGAYRWVLGRALPVRDETGRIERWFGTCTDIEDLKRAEAARRESEERLTLALSAGGFVGTWVWEIPADRVVADERFARLFSVDPAEAAAGTPLAPFLAAIHPEDRDRVAAGIRAAVEEGQPYRAEYRVLQPDGALRWIDARGRCERDHEGRPLRFPGTVVDITDRRLAEEARDLVTRELSHRIKNIFAVIGSLITLSARGEPGARDYAQALRRRIDALAQAQNYVRPHSPESRPAGDADQTLAGLLDLLLAPYQEGDRRVEISGDDAPVGPNAAVALALILHELATNAVKYGALSADRGRILVEVSTAPVDGSRRIVWSEHGGPPVGAPSRQGFGTLMSARAAAGQLGGTIEHDWRPDGLVVTLGVPADRLTR
ncbi:sensor histidine kinase [Prosthecomicrobium sp. N25]|uniref:sensor histidine kinase n=1 Tax=Prosthecomicrobium sp. N25 TaxID=3129254 RepID=UPI0030776122